MKHAETGRPSRLHMPRSRGAVTGLLLIVLGAWGALIPFVGHYFNFAYTAGQEWTWTAIRGWLEVLPGVVVVVGGALLMAAQNRVNAVLGGWLAVLGGAWFVVGSAFAPMLRIGTVGAPVASTDAKRALLEVAYFSGLGALIVFLGGAVLARLTSRLARDVQPTTTPAPPAAAAPAVLPERAAAPVESAPEPSPESSANPEEERLASDEGAAEGPETGEARSESPDEPSDSESTWWHRLGSVFRRQRGRVPAGHTH